MAMAQTGYGPRLVAHPTGTLRAALLIRPNPRMEGLKSIAGEPGAVYSRALEQHGVLTGLLKYFGVEVTMLEAPDAAPFSAAAADLAVCFEHGAVLMRPSSLGRKSEVDAVEAAFARMDVPIAGNIAAPGMLDGSDILLAGDIAFIGVSVRSNRAGRDGFAQIARANGYRPAEVNLDPRAPSLRAVAAAVSPETVVLAPGLIDADPFAGFRTVVLERGEEFGAGVFPLGERHVIANIRYRTAQKQLRSAGIAVDSIDLYDFAKVGLAAANLVLALKRV
ncbi:MAG: dimethylarginine dimethylaminohydrolase family protein [Vulcanimicrobiaceae bacterium]